MTTNKFACPHCSQSISTDESVHGQTVQCPACNKEFVVPTDALERGPGSDPQQSPQDSGATAPISLAGNRSKENQAVENAKVASRDAWGAFKLLAVNPVAGMPSAFERVGVSRALGVGIIFGVVSAVLISFAASSMFEGVFFEKTTVKIFFNLFVISIVPFVSLTAATMMARAVCKGEGSLGHACFVVGASLLPVSILLFLARFIGLGNSEVIGVLALAAACHTLLMLFIGLTRILKISERGASIALPVLLIVAAWVSKIVYTALFENIVL